MQCQYSLRTGFDTSEDISNCFLVLTYSNVACAEMKTPHYKKTNLLKLLNKYEI